MPGEPHQQDELQTVGDTGRTWSSADWIAAAFVLAGVAWFASVVFSESVDAGDAFVGLGYIAAVAVIARLLLVSVGRPPRNPSNPAAATAAYEESQQGSDEQSVIKTQLWIGAGLIALGGTLAIVLGVLFTDENKVAIAIGTAMIGAGAVLLPPGAAAGAHERIKAVTGASEAFAGPPGEEPDKDDDSGARKGDHTPNKDERRATATRRRAATARAGSRSSGRTTKAKGSDASGNGTSRKDTTRGRQQ